MCTDLHIRLRAGDSAVRQMPVFQLFNAIFRMADGVHFLRCPRLWAQDWGAIVMNIFESHAVSVGSIADPSAAPTKKQGWLPLLVVLFLISYALMTMLIVEQGQTIESQRTLIHELFRDSTELSAIKMNGRQKAGDAPSTQVPAAQTPSQHLPSTQAPNRQAPSSQAGPQHRAPNSAATQKPRFKLPSKPASDLVDDNRTLLTI